MNLIEENFQNKEEKKKKKATKIVLVAIVFVMMTIIAIVIYLAYIQSTTMKLTINGQANTKAKNLLVFESDGTIYAPIKAIAEYLGYESYNGEYTDKSENKSKCYIINENEVANFELGETKIYKLDLTTNTTNYEYVYIKKPVKAINGELYVTTEGLEKAFNISFDYKQEANSITIWTTPALYQYYQNKVLDYGYTELSTVFVNQKAILKDQLVVAKDQNKSQYGVIKTDGSIILEPKYENITYLPNTGDFLVKSNEKVGILSATRDTKVEIIYDSIELMDSDAGLYIAKKDNKYGVIDVNGNTKIYIENDEIGVDISRFSQNNIKSKYILAENLIPARKDKFWALYDKKGNQVIEYTYDSLGYIASNNKEALNLLVIPNYNVLVACKDRKYTLINSSGQQLFTPVADDIYMTITGGEKHYYIAVNDQIINAEEWMNKYGITAQGNKNQQGQEQNNNTNSNTNGEKQENMTKDNTSNEGSTEGEEQEENTQENNNQEDNENENNEENNPEQENEGQENNQEEQNGNEEE